mmetsp:Transcript_15723/g.44730  ORF Transcript_15723/g.44730 Transcript_15723/m.44730 type:complete len:213 (-) Transcript_15723:1013-1651(-)
MKRSAGEPKLYAATLGRAARSAWNHWMTDSVSFFVGRTSCNLSSASIGNAAAHSATARQTLSKSPRNLREAIANAMVAFWARFASSGDARIARCCGLFRRTGAVDAFALKMSFKSVKSSASNSPSNSAKVSPPFHTLFLAWESIFSQCKAIVARCGSAGLVGDVTVLSWDTDSVGSSLWSFRNLAFSCSLQPSICILANTPSAATPNFFILR